MATGTLRKVLATPACTTLMRPPFSATKSLPSANGAVAKSGWLKPLATSRVSSVCALAVAVAVAVAVAPARASKTDAARVAVKARW